MDIAVFNSFVPVRLAGNKLEVNIPALNPTTYPDRAVLRYLLEVYIQSFFQASTYDIATIPPADAAEYPPQTDGGVEIYRGADVEINEIVDGYLDYCLPEFSQAAISICPDMVRSYYTKYYRYNGTTLVDTATQNTEYAIKAQISERDWNDWQKYVFTHSDAKAGKFLTWKNVATKIYPEQPEYLYFLNNILPTPTEIRLRVRVHYEDSSYADLTVSIFPNALPMAVYCIPVGPTAIGLEALPKVVLQYEVWLSNQNNERLSEVRYYTLNYTYHRRRRYILFQNSLGGFDTLAMVGSSSEKITMVRNLSERYPDDEPTYAERLIDNVTGEQEITLLTGPMDKVMRRYYQELMYSKYIFLVGKKEHYPLLPTTNDYVLDDDAESLISRTFSFRYSNPTVAPAFLPTAPTTSERLTGWRGGAESCEVDAMTGLRNGMKRFGVLVKYYLDNGQDVVPYTQKNNVPGTVGYIASTTSLDCDAATTPYRNVAISAQSTYRKSTCAVGEIGSTWLIIVPANTYGSHLSQADADAKAQAVWNALDTQTNADLNGTCQLDTAPLAVKIINTVLGPSNLPVAALLVGDVQIVTNTSYNLTGQSGTLTPGTYNLDVRIEYSASPFQAFRIRISAKNRTSPQLSGNQTYRFENVTVYSIDSPLEIVVENV